MNNENYTLDAIPVYESCDRCMKPIKSESDRRLQDWYRPAMGSDDWVLVLLCPQCDEELKRA